MIFCFLNYLVFCALKTAAKFERVKQSKLNTELEPPLFVSVFVRLVVDEELFIYKKYVYLIAINRQEEEEDQTNLWQKKHQLFQNNCYIGCRFWA